MEQIVYYTFSTIPQVLGAIIALLGVFIIFKIQHSHNVLDGEAQIFYEIIIKNKFLELNKNLIFESKITRNYSEVLKQMDNIINLGNDFYKELTEGKDIIPKNVERYKNIIDNQLIPIKDTVKMIITAVNKLKKDAIFIVTVSGFIIIGSVFLLPFSNTFCKDYWILIICITIVIFAWNILKSVKLIIGSLKELY